MCVCVYVEKGRSRRKAEVFKKSEISSVELPFSSINLMPPFMDNNNLIYCGKRLVFVKMSFLVLVEMCRANCEP